MNDKAEKIKDWTAKQHIDRACELAETAENAYVGEVPPDTLALARLHCDIAQVKMVGRMRVRV